jgi:hypothetical protein
MKRLPSESALCWAVCALIFAIQAATLNAAPDWIGDDYAAYIANAQSLLTGAPYPLAAYVPNLAVDSGPAAYPPGLPALLTLPIRWFGVDFTAIAVVNILVLTLAVRLIIAWMRPAIPLPTALAAGLLIGLSPFAIAFKGVVASEFLCLALIFAWLLLERRPGRLPKTAAALALAAALLTRLAAAPALLAPLLRRRPRWANLLIPLAAAALAWLILTSTVPDLLAHYRANINANTESVTGESGLKAMLALLPANLLTLPGRLAVLWSYAGQGAQPPLNLIADIVRKLATAALLLAGFAGLALRLRRGVTSAETFFLLSLAMLAVLPAIMAGPRLFLALSVLLIAYALEFADVTPRPQLARIATLATLFLASAISWTSIATTPPTQYTATEPRAQALYNYLRAVPRANEAVLAHRARAIAFFTGRSTTDWHQDHADDAFLAWAESQGATMLLLAVDDAPIRRIARGDTSIAALNAALDRFERNFLGADKARFTLLFGNDRFRLYGLPTP